MYKKLSIMCMAIVLMCSIGCATLSLQGMQPKDYVTIAMGVYIQQYDRHVREATRNDLTLKEREDLQDLKENLIRVYDPISLAVIAVNAGDDPTAENMQAIMDFLNKYYYKRR